MQATNEAVGPPHNEARPAAQGSANGPLDGELSDAWLSAALPLIQGEDSQWLACRYALTRSDVALQHSLAAALIYTQELRAEVALLYPTDGVGGCTCVKGRACPQPGGHAIVDRQGWPMMSRRFRKLEGWLWPHPTAGLALVLGPHVGHVAVIAPPGSVLRGSQAINTLMARSAAGVRTMIYERPRVAHVPSLTPELTLNSGLWIAGDGALVRVPVGLPPADAMIGWNAPGGWPTKRPAGMPAWLAGCAERAARRACTVVAAGTEPWPTGTPFVVPCAALVASDDVVAKGGAR